MEQAIDVNQGQPIAHYTHMRYAQFGEVIELWDRSTDLQISIQDFRFLPLKYR